MLTARKINKSYKSGTSRLQVLEGINIDVEKGEMFFVVGPSGAGKSTLLHILGGLDVPDSGDIYINGYDFKKLKGRKRSKLINSKIGFVFQFFHLLPEFTAVENVMLPALISGKSRKRSFEKASGLLNQVDLEGRLNHRPSQLSGGEKQRVAVARALVNDPEIVFADEPTGNLDLDNSRELTALIHKLNREKGQTFIIATHDYNIVSKESNVMRLVNGTMAG
ncbi:MAG: ABC transporter ATP-binding protein [Candidatus Aureabacteria bacterium]|nr:ABC transporter ATP-binding protein [Candidatus Auribacterota bacterium]